MLILPIETQDHIHDTLLIVLDRSNLERMKQADPAEVNLRQCDKQLLNPTILICYEEEQAKLTKMIHQGNIMDIINYLQRGWNNRPEKGDGKPPESLRGQS